MTTRTRKIEYILAEIDEDAPAKPPTGLDAPTFYDPTTETVVWINEFGAVEVPAERWHSGEFARMVMTAGWSSRVGAPLPAWATVQVFHSPFTQVDPGWAVVGQLWTTET